MNVSIDSFTHPKPQEPQSIWYLPLVLNQFYGRHVKLFVEKVDIRDGVCPYHELSCEQNKIKKSQRAQAEPSTDHFLKMTVF